MTVKPDSFGYIGVSTKQLDDWRSFGRNFLGMQLIDRSSKTLAFRMDDRKQRVIVNENGSEGADFFGWEVADAAALDRFAAHLEASGVRVARGSRALADERHVKDLIVFQDPGGNRLETFFGPETTNEPFQPGRSISGFRTGPLGMGHVVLMTDRFDDMSAFYQGILGFRLSDYTLRPFKAFFFHVNPRHHSLALLEAPNRGMHHMMVELFNLDDVGQGYDLALQEEGRVKTTFGRHSNDLMTSFYCSSPSAFMVEYGWGGRSVDPDTWEPYEMTYGASLWGHDRIWLPDDLRKKARELALQAGREGRRHPVQVIEGNYQLAPGTCVWWDESVKASHAEASAS